MIIEDNRMIYDYVAGVACRYDRKRITQKLINNELLEKFGKQIEFDKNSLKLAIKQYYNN